jgi:hypothetical protein
MLQALPILSEDPESIEILLQNYFAREMVSGKPSKKLVTRLNCTLNTQWLLDITVRLVIRKLPRKLISKLTLQDHILVKTK